MTLDVSEPEVAIATAGSQKAARWWVVPLTTWVGSRVGIILITLASAWLVQGDQLGTTPSFTSMWDRWDVQLFRKAAQYGWYGAGSDPHQAVDFPGLPLLMRVIHPVTHSWIIAGIVISAVAGVATCIALYRVAAAEDGDGVPLEKSVTGRRAVVYLVIFPYAVFLFAGYSEGLFLAFVVTSWLCARQERWLLAVVLAAGATATRVTGLAFLLGLGVEYVVTRRREAVRTGADGGRSLWTPTGLRTLVDRRAPLLALPLLPVVAYFSYLHHHTGEWNAYAQATNAGWGRHLGNPVGGWRTTWDQAFGAGQSADFAWFWRAELIAVLVALALTIVLVIQQRWGEATYTGVTFLMMACTNYYGSGVRSVLVLFPLYLLLARLSERRAWLHGALVWTMAPLMAALTVAFVGGAWLD